MGSEISNLLDRLAAEAGGDSAVLTYAGDRERWLIGGLERRGEPAAYRWHGLHRGADPTHPFIVFQYTLAGEGAYRAANGPVQPLPRGSALVAVVPSDHLYYLPETAAQTAPWTFFWLIIRHPYVVQRIIAAQARIGAVLELGDTESLLSRAAALLQSLRAESFRDRLALEQALLEWMVEYDRFAEHLLHPPDAKSEMLEWLRRMLLNRQGRAVEVAEIAEARGMSRSHFSHHFKAVTGIAPAQWMKEVAMDEAVRRLMTTDLMLEAVARSSGFANANHFCKAFRRRFHASPGEFRRQMRRGTLQYVRKSIR